MIHTHWNNKTLFFYLYEHPSEPVAIWPFYYLGIACGVWGTMEVYDSLVKCLNMTLLCDDYNKDL